MSDVLATIERARQHIDADASLAVYMVRDLAETRSTGLDGVAWERSRAYCPKPDAVWLLDALEGFVTKVQHEKS